MSDSRLEKFIYAICSMEVTDLPVPLSRIEKLWNCLITGETPDFEPFSRNEKYLMAMLDRYDISNLPAPMSRGEKLLYKIAVGETDLSDIPGYLSRYEELLKYLIENGGISGGDFEYVLHTLNQSLSTLYQTVEKPVKSAILKGQTLVNLARNFKYQTGWKYEWGGETENAQRCSYNVESAKGNTKYLIKNFNESTQAYIRYYSNSSNAPLLDSGWLDLPAIITTPTNTAKFVVSLRISDNNEEYISPDQANKNLVVECQGDVENWGIPYFEGMQSVKLPVLTTSNLGNLLKREQLQKGMFKNDSGVVIPTIDMIISDFIVREFDEYTLSHSGSWCWTKIFEYDGEKVFIQSSETRGNSHTAILNERTKFVRIGIEHSFSLADTLDIKLCPYASRNSQPYKSNILTVNEDVTLRSNGDICDELNLLTGQLTQRIGEDGVVLSQEVVKTVDLTTVDQDGQPTKLKTFNDITYVEINADSIIPSVNVEVATKMNETLSTMGLEHHDISNTQNKLGQTIDEQTENTDATMMATTEIYEQTL